MSLLQLLCSNITLATDDAAGKISGDVMFPFCNHGALAALGPLHGATGGSIVRGGSTNQL